MSSRIFGLFLNICRGYSKKVIEHCEQPKNVGSFCKNEANVGTGLVGAPACGDVMKLQIKVEGDVIVDAKFKTFGCGSAIASSSFVTEAIIGKTLDEAEALANKDIAKELGLPPVKLHCSSNFFLIKQKKVLAEDAIKEAIKNYRESHNKNTN